MRTKLLIFLICIIAFLAGTAIAGRTAIDNRQAEESAEAAPETEEIPGEAEATGKAEVIEGDVVVEEQETTDNGLLVVIDPGHQQYADSGQEPIGPGASETKAKVFSGTSEVVTGTPEYELNLQVSLKLQAELENRAIPLSSITPSDSKNQEGLAKASLTFF